MKNILTLILFLFSFFPAFSKLYGQEREIDFNEFFYPKTMRFDFYHAGDSNHEFYFFDELKEEPYFAGSHIGLIDAFGYGGQQFRLIDKASGKLIYQHNYCTLFNEWMYTEEATVTSKAMSESLIFPYPIKPTILEIYSRNKKGEFEKKFSYEIDPQSCFVRLFTPYLSTFDVSYQGASDKRLDIALIAEGYAQSEKPLFEDACRRFAEALFSYSPFKEYKSKINIRAVWSPSQQSGVTIPGERIWRNTATDARFYTFNSERYQMITDQQQLRDIAAHVPYDVIYVLSNTQKYGGGGIYNFYGISAANHPVSSGKVFVHEFGHLLLGLGDEYVEQNSDFNDMYPVDVEPWEANLTTLVDFGHKPWKKLLDAKTPVPTPLPKSDNPKDWKLGVYEGGGYVSKGIYRPMPNCMMNWLHTIDIFCPVCQDAIRSYLDFICQ